MCHPVTMADEEATPTSGEPADVRADIEHRLQAVAEFSENFMDVLEVLTAFVMVVLFAVGVYDLGLKLYHMMASGTFTDPEKVIKLIDTALLLLIIVEIYRTVVAYIEDLNILPLVVNVALIAMARKIISFRTSKFHAYDDALMAAAAYGLLMVVLVATFFLVHKVQEDTRFDIYSEPFSSEDDREGTAAD